MRSLGVTRLWVLIGLILTACQPVGQTSSATAVSTRVAADIVIPNATPTALPAPGAEPIAETQPADTVGYGDFPRMAVAVLDHRAGQLALFRVERDGATLLFAQPEALGASVEPVVSPDGRRVALITTDLAGGTTLWSGPFDGTGPGQFEPVLTGTPISGFGVTGALWSENGDLLFSTAGPAPGGLMNAGLLWRHSADVGVQPLGSGAFHRLLGPTDDPDVVFVARRLNEQAEWLTEGWARFSLATHELEPLVFTAAGDRAFYLWLDVATIAGPRAVTLYSEGGRGSTVFTAPATILSLDPATNMVAELWAVPPGALGVGQPVWEPGATWRFALELDGEIMVVDGRTGAAEQIHSPLGRILAWAPQGLVVLDDHTLRLRLLSLSGLVIGEIDLAAGVPSADRAHSAPSAP